MACYLLHNYAITFEKITSVFRRWIVFYNQAFKMFFRVDIVRF